MPYGGSKRAAKNRDKIVKLVQKDKNKKAAKVAKKHNKKMNKK